MGKRGTASRHEVILENHLPMVNDDSFVSAKKRLRVSSPQDTAALTLLSLKREAVCFSPMTAIPISNCGHSVVTTESTVCSSSKSCCSVTDDESVNTASPLKRVVGTITRPKMKAAMPLRKPTLCHLSQTKAVQPAVEEPCVLRPLASPPALPKFLVQSSYAPFAVPQSHGKQ